jgi:general secretion pathway protein G
VLALLAIAATLVGLFLRAASGFDESEHARIGAAMQADLLCERVLLFRHEQGRLPSALSELVADPPGEQGPYSLARHHVDPWGRSYLYSVASDGSFELGTLGEDGRPGGDGNATDYHCARSASDIDAANHAHHP